MREILFAYLIEYLVVGILIGAVLETCLYYKKKKLFTNYRKPTFDNIMIGIILWPVDVCNHIKRIRLILHVNKCKKQLLKDAARMRELNNKLKQEQEKIKECREYIRSIQTTLDQMQSSSKSEEKEVNEAVDEE